MLSRTRSAFKILDARAGRAVLSARVAPARFETSRQVIPSGKED
jgi:hypothetical protein